MRTYATLDGIRCYVFKDIVWPDTRLVRSKVKRCESSSCKIQRLKNVTEGGAFFLLECGTKTPTAKDNSTEVLVRNRFPCKCIDIFC